MAKKLKKPRIPPDVLRRLGSHPITTKKGKKGYLREGLKKETKDIVNEEAEGQ